MADGNIRWPNGSLPVNTHGGNLSEAYIIGMTHVKEAVEQIRGTAVNQVEGAELALVTGGPASIPTSGHLAAERPVSAARGGVLPPDIIALTPNVVHRAVLERDRGAPARRCRAAPSCGTYRFPPSPFCFVCRAQEVEWVEHDGRGTLYSFTVVRHAVIPDVADALPVVVGVVELPDTGRMPARRRASSTASPKRS